MPATPTQLYSPTRFLRDVDAVAQAYQGAGARHMNTIRRALDVSHTASPNARRANIERAVIGGLLTQAKRNDAHVLKLTKAWRKYREWHAAHAHQAFKPSSAPRSNIRSLPAHLFAADIARHLSDANAAALAQAFRKNNPATNYVADKKAAMARELRWWVRFAAHMHTKKGVAAERAIAAVTAGGFGMPGQQQRAGYRYSPKVRTEVLEIDASAGEFMYEMYGEFFGMDLEVERNAAPDTRIFTRENMDQRRAIRARHGNGVFGSPEANKYSKLWKTSIDLWRSDGKLRTRSTDFKPTWRSVVKSEVAKITYEETG